MEEAFENLSLARQKVVSQAEESLRRGESADEFAKLAQVGFAGVYLAASKDSSSATQMLPHANPADRLLYMLDGEVEVGISMRLSAGSKELRLDSWCSRAFDSAIQVTLVDTDPQCHHKGISTLMLHRLRDLALELGFCPMRLLTTEMPDKPPAAV